MIDNALELILKGDTGITNYVGNRIYPMKIPQQVANPCIRFYTKYVVPLSAKGGPAKMENYGVQIDVFADVKYDADQIFLLIKTLMDRNIKGVYGGVDIASVNFEGYEDEFEEEYKDFVNRSDWKISIHTGL